MCFGVRLRRWRWRGGGGRTELFQFRQETADVRGWSGRPVGERPVAGGRPVPGRFQARDKHLGFVTDRQNLVKIGRICGWKWWR